MNDLTFSFANQPLNIQVDEAGEIWFPANEVCLALEYTNPWQALKTHVANDDLQKLEVIDNLGRKQQANYINESGVYTLIFGSTKDSAKAFKRWVTHEVLPSIRKTGSYGAQPQLTYEANTNIRVAIENLDMTLRQMNGRIHEQRDQKLYQFKAKAKYFESLQKELDKHLRRIVPDYHKMVRAAEETLAEQGIEPLNLEPERPHAIADAILALRDTIERIFGDSAPALPTPKRRHLRLIKPDQ